MREYHHNCVGYIKDGSIEIILENGTKEFMMNDFMKLELPKLYDKIIDTPITLGFEIRIHDTYGIWVVFYLIEQVYGFAMNTHANIINAIGHVETFTDDEDCTIKWVGIRDDIKFRGKGLAKYLMYLALSYSKLRLPSTTRVILDDDSDYTASGDISDKEREEKLSKNIYYRMGFRYVDPPPHGPEMESEIDTILENSIHYIENIKLRGTKNKRDTLETERETSIESDYSTRSKKRVRRGGGKKKLNELFNKYSKNKKYLTKSESIKLMKDEYNLNYNSNIINSMMNIWGVKVKGKCVITKNTFSKLFDPPDGFFRDYK